MKLQPALLELRNYILNQTEPAVFNSYFEQHFLTPQVERGGYPLGQYRIIDQPDRFFWIRGFETAEKRNQFLPAFYDHSPEWKQHGAAANAMIADSDQAHLLQPVNFPGQEQVSIQEALQKNKVLEIDFYIAAEGQLEELIAHQRRERLTHLGDGKIAYCSLWVSEMASNRFRHPVIQDKDLLVIITAYADETQRLATAATSQPAIAPANRDTLIKDKTTLILHSLTSK